MIRFLQKDSPLLKGLFVVIISVAAITMVVTLVPGIFSDSSSSSDNYATVRSRRYFGSVSDITVPQVQQVAQRMLAQQRLPDMALPYLMPRAAQALVQREVLLMQANRMGLQVSDEDLRRELQSGPFAQALFPNGEFVGTDRYADFVETYFHTSIQDFENQVKKEIEVNRLEAMVTGGITVSDQEVRDAYLQQGTKIKFDYAVINGDDLSKQINPSDADLETFFKENLARYRDAVPEKRKVEYTAFNQSQIPGGAPTVSEQEIAQYYAQHQADYKTPEQVTVRHILIKVPANADAKTDAQAKQQAETILAQLKAGADFAELARKYSDDPGSKDQGGELGPIQRGVTVPAFENAAFSLQPGQLSNVVKTQFGYHILKVEAKQQAHTKSLDEVKGQILASLTRDHEAQQEAAFARQLAAEAAKSGMAATAAAHHLQLVTTDELEQNAIVPGLADGSKLLSMAFASKVGAPPQVASTGDGYALFSVVDDQPAHAPAFADYKAHVLDDFRQQQLPQLLSRKVNELAAKAKAEGNLAQAAKETGATVKTSDLVGRSAQVPGIGDLATTAPEIFNLNVGETSAGINTGHSGVVVKIVSREQPSAEDIAKNFDTTRDRMLSERRDQMFAVFVNDLQDRYQKQGLIRLIKRAQLGQGLPG